MMIKRMNEPIVQKAADTAAVGAGLFAGASWVAQAEPYITVAAALVAIIAGASSAWYHIERAKYMRRKNRAAGKGGSIEEEE